MKKRLLALVLACMMLVGMLAACNSDPPAPVTTPGAETPAEQPATPMEPPVIEGHDPRAYQAPPADWRTPYDLPVQLNAAADQATNWFFEDGDDVHNSPWTRLFRDELNVHVVFDWLAASDMYDTQLNMAVAAGNLPDTFYIDIGNNLLFSQLVEGDMLLDLTDAYNNYASQRIRDYEKASPMIDGYTVDGRIYGIPRYNYGEISNPWPLWVRKDWYEAAGEPEIRTVEDFENLAKTFMAGDATYGLAVDSELQWLFRTGPMFEAYIGNVHENQYFWQPDASGTLVPCIAMPEFLTALEYWVKWYKDGIISPDFVTLNQWGNADDEIVNGRVGMQAWFQWWGWMYGPNAVALQGSDDAIFIPHFMPTVDGNGPAKGTIFYSNYGVIVASKNLENPAALMKVLSMVDHMVYSPDADLSDEEITYYMEAGREHSMTGTFDITDPSTDMIQYQHVRHALDTGDTSQLFTTGMRSKFNDSLQWINDRNPDGLGAYLQQGHINSSYSRNLYLLENNLFVRNAMWGPTLQTYNDIGSIGDIIIEEVTLIIMGVNPISHFESVLEQWYAQGGQLLQDEVNATFG